MDSNKFSRNRKSKSLEAYYSLDEYQLIWILHIFKKIFRARSRYSTPKSSLNVWSKITSEHIQAVKEFVEAGQNQRINVSQVSQYLERNDNLKQLSFFSIRKILKQFLQFRYKILHEVHPKTFWPNSINQFFESAYIQVWLEAEGVELVYIDEFSFILGSRPSEAGSKEDSMGFSKKLTEDTSASCAVAFSRKVIYGVAGSRGTLDSEHFIRFLQNLIFTLKEKF